MPKVLFVCLGNICRSPAAQGVLESVIIKKNESLQNWLIDSAGTSSFHSGAHADPRMREAAKQRGLDLTSLSRGFVREDFEKFEYIIAMDRKNLSDLKAQDSKQRYSGKLYLMSEFFENFDHLDVPDPYYGGEQGFELVLDMLEEGCENLFIKINKDVENAS